MIPPTSIDGTDITGATIDGTDVQEITVDGDTVFTAGPPPAPDLSNLQNHYAARLETNYNDGDTVTIFTDQIGNNDASNSTSGGRGTPNYSTNEINGQPAVNYQLEAHDTGKIIDTSISRTIYAVFRQDTTGNNGSVWGYFSPNNYMVNSLDGRLRSRAVGTSIDVPGAIPAGQTHMVVFIRSGGGFHEVFVNGNSVGTDTDSNNEIANNPLTIGMSNRGPGTTREIYDGVIAEILIYEGVTHSAATRQSVENYLNGFYNVF